MMNPSLSSLLLVASCVAAATDAFECPSVYTLTSTDCASFCKDASIPSDGCIYYPATGEFPCADTSVGYCAATSSAACSVKCLATSFQVDDTASLGDGTRGKALSLGLRGSAGSFGRSEPIQAIHDLALKNVTKLSIKDFLLDSTTPPTHHISMLPASSDAAARASQLQTLELTNVQLDFPADAASAALPPSLTTLVLNNNALSHAAASSSSSSSSSLRQDSNAIAAFPVEIFSSTSLQSLDLRSNTQLQKSSFSADELAFFGRLKSFAADFTL